ncbi:MAG: hypothetical protein ACXQTI_08850 [Candidatus Nezhaarchaeales archaeon]
MGRKRERVLEVRHILAKKTHKLTDGSYKEYAYDQYFLSTYIHVPKSWVEEGYRTFKLIAVDKAHSFLIIPENVSRQEIIELRRKLKSLLKQVKE